MHACMYVCMQMCMYVCMYVCVYACACRLPVCMHVRRPWRACENNRHIIESPPYPIPLCTLKAIIQETDFCRKLRRLHVCCAPTCGPPTYVIYQGCVVGPPRTPKKNIYVGLVIVGPPPQRVWCFSDPIQKWFGDLFLGGASTKGFVLFGPHPKKGFGVCWPSNCDGCRFWQCWNRFLYYGF